MAKTSQQSLGHKVTVSSVPKTVTNDVIFNIKKRIENVIYRTTSNEDNINLSYLIGKQVTPTNNLSITDRSTFLNQNRILSKSDYITRTTASFNLNVDKFLVTGTFTTDSPTQPEVPLFYVHTLSNFNPLNTDWGPAKVLLSIEFTDSLLKTRKITDYVLDKTTGEVFNNIENSFNRDTVDFDVTYIKYSVKKADVVSVYHELISNEVIYDLATFDDINEFGILNPTARAYLVEQIAGGAQYLITMPSSQKWAWRESPKSRIRAYPPTALDIDSPWFIKVSNGQFITSLPNGSGGSGNYRYRIAEFLSQTFDPYPPYKLVQDEKAIWLADNLIKVSDNIAVDSSILLYTEIIIQDFAEEVKYVYSNNPLKIGTNYSSTIEYTDGILSIDELNGFIEVTDLIKDTDIIYVTYYSIQEYYEFTSLNLNPINTPSIINQRLVIYVNPETSSTGDLDRTLYYLTVDEDGRIIYSSQAALNSTGTDAATQKLLREDFTTLGAPKHIFPYDIESTASGIAWNASGIFKDYFDEFSFIDKYTVETSLPSNVYGSGMNFLNSGELYINYASNPKFLILADIFVGDGAGPDNITDIDIRVKGGGIKEEELVDVFAEQPDIALHRDINGGKPYPGMNSFYVEVPSTLTTKYDGIYTKEQLKEVCNRHIALGTYPIVRTYGDLEPHIVSSTSLSGAISFSWPSYGPEASYNVYQSTSINESFSGYNSSPILDSGIINNYRILGLNPGTKYYVYVSAIKDGNEFNGPIVAIDSAIS